MSKHEDTQYKKLSQQMSNTVSDRDHSRQISQLADRDLKNMRQRK